MKLNPFIKWALRQALGARRGANLIWLLEETPAGAALWKVLDRLDARDVLDKWLNVDDSPLPTG